MAPPSIVDLVDNNIALHLHTPSPVSPSVTLPDAFKHPWDRSPLDPPPQVSFDLPPTNAPSLSTHATPVVPFPPLPLYHPVLQPPPPPTPLPTTRRG